MRVPKTQIPDRNVAEVSRRLSQTTRGLKLNHKPTSYRSYSFQPSKPLNPGTLQSQDRVYGLGFRVESWQIGLVVILRTKFEMAPLPEAGAAVALVGCKV